MAFLTSKRTGRAVVLTLAIVAGFARCLRHLRALAYREQRAGVVGAAERREGPAALQRRAKWKFLRPG